MAGKRGPRLNEQMRRELTELLQLEVRDPRIGLITVTGVEVSPDLYHAKVFFTALGDAEERDRALEGLRAAAGFLRTEIGRRMRIRRTPELHFTYDPTLDHAMHIERLLREVRDSTPDLGASAAGSDPAEEGAAGDDTSANERDDDS